MASPALGELARKAFQVVRTGSISDPLPQFTGVNGQISLTDGISTLAGLRVSEEGALRVAAAWIANTLIADEISSLVFKLVARGDRDRRPVEPAGLEALWDRPNPDQTHSGWLATSSLSLTLWGVSYTMTGWTRDGGLGVLWPVDPDPARTRLERVDGETLRLKVTGQGELTNRPGSRPEFMMVPLYQLPGRLQPVSPVRMAAELLGLSQSYETTAANLMGRGLNPTAILTADEPIDGPVAEELASRLERAHGGARRAGKIAVLGGKGLKLERLTMSMADAQFVAQSDRVFAIVMALWRVPPTVAGMVDKPSTWGTGVAEFARGLERFTLRPIVQRLQAGFEANLTKWVDPALQVRFAFDSMLSASPKDRAEIQRLNVMGGITSVERVLAQNDEPPFDADETVYSQLSTATGEDRRLDRLRRQAQAYAALIAAGMAPAEAARAVGLGVAAPAAGG